MGRTFCAADCTLNSSKKGSENQVWLITSLLISHHLIIIFDITREPFILFKLIHFQWLCNHGKCNLAGFEWESVIKSCKAHCTSYCSKSLEDENNRLTTG